MGAAACRPPDPHRTPCMHAGCSWSLLGGNFVYYYMQLHIGVVSYSSVSSSRSNLKNQIKKGCNAGWYLIRAGTCCAFLDPGPSLLLSCSCMWFAHRFEKRCICTALVTSCGSIYSSSKSTMWCGISSAAVQYSNQTVPVGPSIPLVKTFDTTSKL